MEEDKLASLRYLVEGMPRVCTHGRYCASPLGRTWWCLEVTAPSFGIMVHIPDLLGELLEFATQFRAPLLGAILNFPVIPPKNIFLFTFLSSIWEMILPHVQLDYNGRAWGCKISDNAKVSFLGIRNFLWGK